MLDQNLAVLIIDDFPEMRQTLRSLVLHAGVTRPVEQARDIREAFEALSKNRFDVILCDYNLGRGANGQQFLEAARSRNLLPLSTVFIMVTAESGYQLVTTAAELTPDDYLLKPFTAQQLGQRIERALEKKQALAPIYRFLYPNEQIDKALAACETLIAARSPFAAEAQKIAGELLLKAKRSEEALRLYESVLDERAVPWAYLGKARALIALGRRDDARSVLQETIRAYPQLIAAHDALYELLRVESPEAAKKLLEQTVQLAPSTRRLRQLAEHYLEEGQFEACEQVAHRIIKREAEGLNPQLRDYYLLAQSRLKQDKPKEALEATKMLAARFERDPSAEGLMLALNAHAYQKLGNRAAARETLEKIQALPMDTLTPEAALEAAQAFLQSGFPDHGFALLKHLNETRHDDEHIVQAMNKLCATLDLPELAAQLDRRRRELFALNNEAVLLARQGRFDEALAKLESAHQELPQNASIAINAALVALAYAQQQQQQGSPAKLIEELIEKAQSFLARAEKAQPNHPRLGEAQTALQRFIKETT